ncbi:hypothetical protein GTO89_09785 [Heliobacterium gestii]|uniref:Glycosyltransferase RgtA/B/C/D-like domain-containing protein n=1 Tax=Heliomicrobium gestii TaxID=2699 RepID=A0A845LFE6_HELGE|nr:hypothetical protein [Heliomicrobium gestii]MBM7867859.1 hypothetical protein [Heliomicrobium gestii]MZP43329.1 hypothetical protein [Heliomicrobium gestii]
MFRKMTAIIAATGLSALEAAALFVSLGWMSRWLSAPMHDPDFFWHLQAGRWILDNGRIPQVDPFSFTMTGERWVAHEWLFETILAGVERHLGYTGLVCLGLGLYALFLLMLRCWVRRAAPQTSDTRRSLAIVATTVSLFPFWSLRPQLFCYILLVGLLLLCEQRRLNGGQTVALALGAACWANSHGSFLLAPALVALRVLRTGPFLTIPPTASRLQWLARIRDDEVRHWLARLVLVLVAGCITPWGPTHYLYPFQVTGDALVIDSISEWQSPNFHHPYEKYILGGSIALFFLAAACRPLSALRWDLYFLSVLFLLMTLTALRHAPLFFIALTALLMGASSPTPPPSPGTNHIPSGVKVATLLIAAGALFYGLAGLPGKRLADHVSPQYPAGAASYLETHPVTDEDGPVRLFNQYDWGGYLIWRLPHQPVFIDGRADLYAGAVFPTYVRIMKLEEPEPLLETEGVRRVLLAPEKPLARWLRLHPAWKVEYEDENSVLFRRSVL